MKARKLIVAGIVLVLTLGLVVGCSDNSVNPTGQSPNAVKLLNANQNYLDHAQKLSDENPGLSRGWLLMDTRYVRADQGALLGGWRTLWNYVEIPPNTLLKDQMISFSLGITRSGVLVFSVGNPGQVDKHIEFEAGQTATLMVAKNWLNVAPQYIVNFDDQSEEYQITSETSTHYIAQVPHFSRWAWGWVTY